MIIHAYDPGGTTGFCVLDTVSHRFLNIADFPDMQMVGKILPYPSLVIIESFKLYPWKANNKKWSSFPEVEVIGALKYWSSINDIGWVEQGADTKKLFDDNKLKALDLWDHVSRHAHDAVRHALYYQTCAGDSYWLNQL